MALHKDVKHLHIGCDEVYHLGECSDCSGKGRTDVFVQHVTTVANYVKNKYKQVNIQSILKFEIVRGFVCSFFSPPSRPLISNLIAYLESLGHSGLTEIVFKQLNGWEKFFFLVKLFFFEVSFRHKNVIPNKNVILNKNVIPNTFEQRGRRRRPICESKINWWCFSTNWSILQA